MVGEVLQPAQGVEQIYARSGSRSKAVSIPLTNPLSEEIGRTGTSLANGPDLLGCEVL